MRGAHATHNSTCERPLVAQGSVVRPSAGKGESASKAMSRLVGTRLREVSYYPSEDDYEHMAGPPHEVQERRGGICQARGISGGQ